MGQVLSFIVNDRESGLALDRLLFSSVNNLDATALDGLANSSVIPEPSSFGLLLIGLVFLRLRKKA